MRMILRAALALAVLAMIGSNYLLADGVADYKAQHCAACHGPTGAGDTVMGKNMKLPDFASAAVQMKSDAELTEIITKGKGKMPSYHGKLSKEQIDGILKWIRTLKK
ncbi:MAG: cytochrome c [Terriglobales bacterium]